MAALSPRLAAVVDALPLRPGMRVLEVGGAPGTAAREVAARVGEQGHVCVVDRSARGVAAVERTAADLVAARRLSVRCTPIEELKPTPGEAPYDLAFANRVGAFDGRHPEVAERAVAAVRSVLRDGAPFFVDGTRQW